MLTGKTLNPKLPIDDADFYLWNDFLTQEEAKILLMEVDENIDWVQQHIQIKGMTIPLPRLTAWYGDEGYQYRYSGTTNISKGWADVLLPIKEKMEAHIGDTFNGCLLNKYLDEKSSISYHADNIKDIKHPTKIAVVSLGDMRKFQLKHRLSGERHDVMLGRGSLFLMGEGSQEKYLHGIPKSKNPVGIRISLTFRQVTTQYVNMEWD